MKKYKHLWDKVITLDNFKIAVENAIRTTATTYIKGNNSTITTGANDKYLIGLAYVENRPIDYRDTLQLEQGSTATPYMPYGEIYTDGTQEVVTDNLGNTAIAEMLLGVGDYKDTQEVLSGKVTRNIGIKVLDGTENWTYVSGNTPRFLTYINTINDLGLRLTPLYNTHLLCVSDGRTLAQTPNNTTYTGGGTGGEIFIQSDNLGTTIADFKAFLADQYANGTPVIIVYPLAEPTTEQVTPQPLAGSSVTVTAGSIDNLPIESSTIAELKKRYIGDKEVKRVYIGENLVWKNN